MLRAAPITVRSTSRAANGCVVVAGWNRWFEQVSSVKIRPGDTIVDGYRVGTTVMDCGDYASLQRYDHRYGCAHFLTRATRRS